MKELPLQHLELGFNPDISDSIASILNLLQIASVFKFIAPIRDPLFLRTLTNN